MRQRRLLVVLTVAGVVALGAAACSKDDPDDAGGGGGNDAPAQIKPLPGTDVLAAARDELKDGGTLRLAIESFPVNFNPAQVDGNNVNLNPTSGSILPRFFRYDKVGNPVPDKDYVESGKVTGEDPFEVTFTVDPRAVWSDGKPIGFADFEGMWKANNGKNEAFQIVSTNGWEQITSMRQGVNDRQIVVRFKAPYAAWPMLFNELLPASLTATPKAFNAAWRDGPSVSGGPFMVSKVDRTAQIITEVPNPKWWGDPPKLAKITQRALDENAGVRAYVNDEIDELVIKANIDAIKQAEGRSHSTVYKAAGLSWYHIDMNGTSPLLKDVKVRQAIVRGIDREQIVKTRLAPVGAPATVRNNHLYNEAQDGYVDNGSDLIGYDPEKAKAALDAAGWKLDGDVRKKDGKSLELRYVLPSDNDRQSQVAQQIQNQLAKIGVKIDLQTVPSNDFFDKYIDVGNLDMVYFAWTGGGFPECDQKSIFFPARSSQNKNFISAPEIGAAFDKACATMDPAERKKAGNVADKAIYELASQIPLYTDPQLAAMNDKLANYTLDTSAFESPVWQDVGFVQ